MKIVTMTVVGLGDMSKPFIQEPSKGIEEMTEIQLAVKIFDAEANAKNAINLIDDKQFNEEFVILNRKFFMGLLRGFKGV